MRELSPIEHQQRFFYLSLGFMIFSFCLSFSVISIIHRPTGFFLFLYIISPLLMLTSVCLFIFAFWILDSRKRTLTQNYDNLLVLDKITKEQYDENIKRLLNNLNWKFEFTKRFSDYYYRTKFKDTNENSLVEIYLHEDIVRSQQKIVVSIYPKSDRNTHSREFQNTLKEWIVKLNEASL